MLHLGQFALSWYRWHEKLLLEERPLQYPHYGKLRGTPLTDESSMMGMPRQSFTSAWCCPPALPAHPHALGWDGARSCCQSWWWSHVRWNAIWWGSCSELTWSCERFLHWMSRWHLVFAAEGSHSWEKFWWISGRRWSWARRLACNSRAHCLPACRRVVKSIQHLPTCLERRCAGLLHGRFTSCPYRIFESSS